ncbi:MAG: serine/threonine-protein kinase [Nannocystaceae bacterium]|nr:serine/threonine-protein kinase [Nannocystaceae bacterium]
MGTRIDSEIPELPGRSDAPTLDGGEAGSVSAVVSEIALTPGETLGRYVVLARIGAGGMGVVFAAWDPELDRRVAIKVMRAVADPERAAKHRARLLREAQALARLDHPNVIAIHDVGDGDGRVWIAMDLVRGQTLAQWLRARPRHWSEVLAKLRPVADGLAAAHEASLVHRDVKPDNVMVSEPGERVRVMDFGLARAPLDAQLDGGSSGTSVSADASRRVSAREGTPGYMAPEQWLGVTADERSDQFGFCVMAYEALFHARPFDGVTVQELAASVVSGQLRPPPRRARGVPGWLRAIVLRGLSRDPERRFPSMAALGEALARGQSRARTRRALFALAGVGGAVAVAVGVAGLDHAARVAACRDEADALARDWNPDVADALRRAIEGVEVTFAAQTAARALPALDAWASRWRASATALCQAARVDVAIDEQAYARGRWCLDERRMELAAALETLSRADARTVRRTMQVIVELAEPDACENGSGAVLAPPVDLDEQGRQEVYARLARARALVLGGDAAQGEALALQVLHEAQAARWPALEAEAHETLAQLHDRRGDFAAARREYTEAYFVALAGGAPATAVEAAEKVAFTVGVRLAEPADAMPWLRHAEILLATLPDPTQLREATHLVERGAVEYAAADIDASEASYQRALAIRERELGPDHAAVAGVLNNLGNIDMVRGRPARAAESYARACAVLRDVHGSAHPDVGTCLVNVASAAAANGDKAGAIALYEQALANLEAALGEAHPSVAANLNNLAMVLATTGETARAKAMYQRALSLAEAALGPEHPLLAHPLLGLGQLALAEGDRDAAARLGERALAIRSRDDTPPRARAEAQWFLAQALGDSDRARARVLAAGARSEFREQDPEAVAEIDALLATWDQADARVSP